MVPQVLFSIIWIVNDKEGDPPYTGSWGSNKAHGWEGMKRKVARKEG